MWLTFIGAVLASVVVIYVPGYFLARAFDVARFASAALAPMFTGLVLALAGALLGLAGVSCPAPALFALALAACLLPFALAMLVRSRASREGGPREGAGLLDVGDLRRLAKVGGAYVAVALVVAAIVFLVAIGEPGAFSRHDDSTMHLAVIRGFLETGTYSFLNAGPYLDQGIEGGFYPAEWYVPVSIVASLVSENVVLANNAMTFTFLVFVFPLAICLLFSALFPDNARVQHAGALFALAFGGFPWGYLVFGQLLPNMMSYMFVPLAFTLLIGTVDAPRPRDSVKLGCACFLGLLGIALAQPNGAFTFGIWAVLYGVSRIFYAPGSETATFTAKRLAGAIALFAAACAVWALAYCAPFFEDVVQHTWEALLKPYEAFAAGMLFMFTWREGIQPFLTAVVLIGVVCTFKDRRYLWLSVAYIAAFAFYIIDMSTDGVVKQVLTGFWYTDYYRTGAMAALFAMPLAAIGFVWLVNLLEKAMGRVAGRKGEGAETGAGDAQAAGAAAPAVASRLDGEGRPAGRRLSRDRATVVSAAVLVVVMAVFQFAPYGVQYKENINAKSGLPAIQEVLAGFYSWDRTYTLDEYDFVERVLDEVPEGALIINVPRDGSCWSYGVQGANMFFRRSHNTGREDDEASKVLRMQLRDVASDDAVRKLVDDLDARYVLMLDADPDANPTTLTLRYKEENWRGIESIDEETPGFTLVLSEGDKRLYRIDA